MLFKSLYPILFTETLTTFIKNNPQTKLIKTAGTTATKNNDLNVPGNPTKTNADNKKVVPLTNVPIGNIIKDIIKS